MPNVSHLTLTTAYATSVCSPIVCIVVSIVAIAGNCFEIAARRSSVDLKISASVSYKIF